MTVYLAVLGGWPRVALARTGQAPATLSAADPDELYRHRDDLASATDAANIWAARAAAGKDFEASWKLARDCYWLGTNGPEKDRRDWLDKGVAAGKQAAALEPNKPEGHFWWAANLGQIAQSGIFAGSKYKGEVKSELETVMRIAPGWQRGSAESALGQWYVKVPSGFPTFAGGDDKKGIALMRQALTYGPESSQIRYTLAEALSDDKKTRAEAVTLLQQVIAARLDPEWAPEDRQIKIKAQTLLAKLTKS